MTAASPRTWSDCSRRSSPQRIGWYESGKLHGFIVGIGVLLFITILVSAIRQRRADRELGQLRWARPTLALSGVLLLLFIVVIGGILAGGFEGSDLQDSAFAVFRAHAAAAGDPAGAARGLVHGPHLARGHMDARCARALLARGGCRARVPDRPQLLEPPWLPLRLSSAAPPATLDHRRRSGPVPAVSRRHHRGAVREDGVRPARLGAREMRRRIRVAGERRSRRACRA